MRYFIKTSENKDKTIILKVSDYAAEQLEPLLKEIKKMGDVGSSRSMKIEDWDGRTRFDWDGDGSSMIYSMEIK